MLLELFNQIVDFWFVSAYLFKIESIPAYSDISFLIRSIRYKKNYKSKHS